MSVFLRDMTSADLPQVIACQQAAFGHDIDPDVVAHEFQGCHRLHPDGLVVAYDGERIVGTIWGAWNGRRAVFSGLSVLPEYQRQGIASALIREVETRFRSKGVTRFSLEVAADNYQVIPLYEHLGFRVKKGLVSMGKNLNNEDGTPLVEVVREYRIRAATMADSSAIRRIRNAAVRESLAIWTSVEQDASQAEAWLSPLVRRGTALVAHLDGRSQDLIGFAVASPWQTYEGYNRTVQDSIYLISDAQGQGLGSRLLAALINSSQQAGDRTMIALIESGNKASMRLHERYGFSTVGTIPQAGEKLGRLLDLTLMSRSLQRPHGEQRPD